MWSDQNTSTETDIVDIWINVFEPFQQILLVNRRNLWIMAKIRICVDFTEYTTDSTILTQDGNIAKGGDFHAESIKLFMI